MKNEGSPKTSNPGGTKSNHKKEQLQKGLNSDDKDNTNITQSNSLVKYDTPFLVSTTISNKKTLEELDENNESAEKFLRNIINKRGGDADKTDIYEDYSVKDALNKIIPPKKIRKNDQLWVQYVSCTPVTKAEVVNLQEGLDRRLQTLQARETGICPIREELYNECFDELIRQVTINCLERGILLMRIKKEIEMTINSYQTLYESSIAYGIRTSLITEEEKGKMSEQIRNIEEECYSLKRKNAQLEREIEDNMINDSKQREEEIKTHEEFVVEYRRKNQILKDEIKSKLSFHNK